MLCSASPLDLNQVVRMPGATIDLNQSHIKHRRVLLKSLYQMKRTLEERRFVFIVTSFNNAAWYERNIGSILDQRYNNYRIIYVDDASTDGTADLVLAYLKKRKAQEKCLLIRNKERMGMAFNRYHAVHRCADSDICIALDGDDWLPDNQVLTFYNQVYKNHNIWLTYGQYVRYPSHTLGVVCDAYEKEVIGQNSFRNAVWRASHLRTFYAWLFKAISLDDFKRDGAFIPAATDFAMMFPMLEMAGPYIKYIKRITCIYNSTNQQGIVDSPERKEQVKRCSDYVRSRRAYNRIRIVKPSRLVEEVISNQVFTNG